MQPPPLLKGFKGNNMPIESKPEVINMDPRSGKSQACSSRYSQCRALGESIQGRVGVWVTCNDIILTRVTPHCHRAFFSRAREIDISFTNIPGIFFSRPDLFGGLSWWKAAARAAPPSDGVDAQHAHGWCLIPQNGARAYLYFIRLGSRMFQ